MLMVTMVMTDGIPIWRMKVVWLNYITQVNNLLILPPAKECFVLIYGDIYLIHGKVLANAKQE